MLTFAATVRPPVPVDTPVTALSKSNIKSDGLVFDKSSNSLYEFLIDSRRLGANGFELFDALIVGSAVVVVVPLVVIASGLQIEVVEKIAK